MLVAVLVGTAGVAACSPATDQAATRPSMGTSTSTPSPRPSGTPPSLTKTFRSPLNHYTISYPAGWSVLPATARWAYPAAGPETPEQGSDILRAPSAGGVFPGNPGWGISAQVIPAGMTDDQWLRWYLGVIGTSSSCNPPYSAYRPIVIDGHAGGVHGGSLGCNFTEAVVVADHIGYVFAAYPNMQSMTDQVYPVDLFEAMLRTARLAPT